MSKEKKDKYGKITKTANIDACEKCKHLDSGIESEVCKHCTENLEYNEHYKKE